MIIKLLMGAALVMQVTPQGELLEVARPHAWKVVRETPDMSLAVMVDAPGQAGDARSLWVILTTSEATRVRLNAPVRQAYALYEVKCAAHLRTNTLPPTSAFAQAPPRLPAPVDPSRTYGPGDELPPVMVMSGPAEYGPITTTSPLARAFAVVCGAETPDYPVVEGTWAEVLTTLEARHDAVQP